MFPVKENMTFFDLLIDHSHCQKMQVNIPREVSYIELP